MPLTDLVVKSAKPKDKQYRLPDGKGLNILVHPNGSKYWQLRYRHPLSQKGRLLQLGIYPEMTLAAAREKAREARLSIKDGIDPIEAKKEARREKEKDRLNTFQLAANAWYEHEESRWSLSTRDKIKWILTSKLGPLIGKLPMAAVKSRDLLSALNSIQAETGSETAKRSLRVAGQVWRYAATTLGVVERDITQELKGQLKSTAVTHRAAITEPKAFGKLMVDIDKYDGGVVVKAATQLSPLFFCRPGELRQLEWAELNWDKEQFEIAGKKMKMGNDHIIPICRQAMEILKALYPVTRRSKYVFAGPKRKGEERPLSENGVRMALNAMGYEKEMTPHGFRASARTLLEEELKFSIDLIEHQSARKVRDPLGRAYNRTQHLDARKEMMQHWADYLDQLKAQAGSKSAGATGLASSIVSFTQENKKIFDIEQAAKAEAFNARIKSSGHGRSQEGTSASAELSQLFSGKDEYLNKPESVVASEATPPKEKGKKHTPLASLIAKTLGDGQPPPDKYK